MKYNDILSLQKSAKNWKKIGERYFLAYISKTNSLDQLDF